MEKKKGNTGLVVTVIILSFLCFLMLSYIVFLKVTFRSRCSLLNNTNQITNGVNNIFNKIFDEIDNVDKDIIYDSEDSTSNIVIPKINIDSIDADNINKSIKSYIDKVKGKVNEYQDINYKYFKNDDIVSLVLVHKKESESDTTYLAYNFNKKTGKEVSNSDLLNKKNLTKDSLISKMKEIFLDKVKTSEGYSMSTGSDPLLTVEQATNSNIEKIDIDDNIMFLNDDGDLCVVIEEYQIAGGETGFYIMNIDKNKYEVIK